MARMTPPSRKSCYNFRVVSIDKVVDGDTIDVTIDLGFDPHAEFYPVSTAENRDLYNILRNVVPVIHTPGECP